MAIWMVLIQLGWVALALAHRRRDPRDGSVPVVDLRLPWEGLLLPLARFLRFLAPERVRSPRVAPWIDPSTGASGPASPAQALDDLAASVDAATPWRRLSFVAAAAALLVMGLLPPVVMALAARGVLVGDPTAQPDVLAAFGAYVVTVGALLSARLHTRASVVWAPLYPVSVAFLAFGWILGIISAPPPPEEGPPADGAGPGPAPTAPVDPAGPVG